jgi:outer membrane protein OmpA-like peptidoglycan-associated protein
VRCRDPDAVDTDQDGLPDSSDRCVEDPEDRDGWEDGDGCPDLDDDEDGLRDAVDRCPRQAEVFNGYQDEDGCPDEAPAEAELRALTARIYFPHSRAYPTGPSRAVVRDVARLIQMHPEWERITIEGHASDTGEPDYNLELSRRRADRVREMLIEAGVDGRRLETVGFGQSRPEVEGSTEEAHAQNRRVTFTVVQRRR